MSDRHAILTAIAGPNKGDTLTIELGSCRLIGRSLSEHETVLIDRDGNRMLDAPATALLNRHLKDRTPLAERRSDRFASETFERGADVICADASISRAHVMLFHDDRGIGIIDLGSKNGTFLNARRINTAVAVAGDVIGIGESEWSVSMS